MTAFLKGFADSEGSVNEEGYILIYNTDLGLLEYIKDLLKHLDIESTRPWPARQQEEMFYDPKTMKKYVRNKDEYRIYIRANSNINFHEKIRFTIRRKQRRLENYIRRCPAKPPLPSFLHAYYKTS
jgi:intein-encoded DNA endonuclease-like protein